MSQLAWPAFTEKSKERHLVVIEVPADVPEDPAALVGTLTEPVRPKSDFALCRERTAAGARLFCLVADLAEDREIGTACSMDNFPVDPAHR